MEVLKDQINIFGVLDKEAKVEKKAAIKSVIKAHKNKSEKNNETEVLEGQITVFELVETDVNEAISTKMEEDGIYCYDTDIEMILLNLNIDEFKEISDNEGEWQFNI